MTDADRLAKEVEREVTGKYRRPISSSAMVNDQLARQFNAMLDAMTRSTIALILRERKQVWEEAAKVALDGVPLNNSAEAKAFKWVTHEPNAMFNYFKVKARGEGVPMTWREARPTEPGWYWWKMGDHIDVVELEIIGGWLHLPSEYGYKRVSETSGQWSGPLEPPEERDE